jgi:serine protease inhibitor
MPASPKSVGRGSVSGTYAAPYGRMVRLRRQAPQPRLQMIPRPYPRRVLSLGIAFALTAGLASPPRIAAQEAGGQQAAQSSTALGLDLYRSFATKEGNVLFSPYSISMSLALLSAGADGDTKKQILDALHWGKTSASPTEDFGALDRHLESATQGDDILTVADGLWRQQGGDLLPAFIKTAQSDLGAEVRDADFINNAPAAQAAINNWVSLKTSGKIHDLIPAGSLNGSSRLVLVNAVYFKGRWEHPFKASGTRPRPFFVGQDQSVMVPTMSETDMLKVVSVPACDIVELPYNGGGLSMVILLPKAHDGLGSLEQLLTPTSLFEWLASLDFAKQQNTNVMLPLFKMTYSVDLSEALEQAGVTAALSEHDADFSMLDGRRDLHVSAAVHKAFVDVSELGTEAAASTYEAFVTLGVESYREFNVDHPFIFLIRDNSTGCLLFLGRVVDPRAISTN